MSDETRAGDAASAAASAVSTAASAVTKGASVQDTPSEVSIAVSRVGSAVSAASSAMQAGQALAQNASPQAAGATALSAVSTAATSALERPEAQQARQAIQQGTQLAQTAAALAQNHDASAITGAAGQLAGTVAQAAGASETLRTAISAAQQAAQYANSVIGAASARSPSSGGGSGSTSGESSSAGGSSGATARSGNDSAGSSRTHGLQLPPETYAFEVQDDAVPGWSFVSFEGREALSELYEFTLVLEHEHELQDPRDLLGKNVALHLERDHHERRFVGVVRQTIDLGSQGQHQRARVVLVPALWTLSLRKTSRIFQGKTVPEIVGEVLRAGLQPTQRTFDPRLRGTYPPREYCVQYNETDLGFVQRLLAEEGIGFFFEHTATKEVLVLFDDNSALTPVLDGDADKISVANGNPQMHPEHTVQSFPWTQSMGSTKSVVRDWDWTQPVRKESTAAAGENADAYEVYSGQGEATIANYAAPRYGSENTRKQATLRRQQQALGTQRSDGKSNVTLFVPGRTFRLLDHAQTALEQRYTLVSVEHRGSNHRVSASGAKDAQDGYANAFLATPHATPWRPARLPRPRLVGVQSAKVVGPQDEEIYTDEHGRIKVRFHWDRVEDDDENASCWMRVAQSWAGREWGFVFIPRVGMEVLVQFVDGNPDRPLITGSVYDGDNTPPYALPTKKTQSTIKTRSTPGGDGYNELRFEDAAGEEEVFLRAQKDFNERVLNNHTTRVGANQTNAVRSNQNETVGGSQSMSVSGDRTKSITGNETTTVRKNRTETVTQDETITVHGKRTETVDHSDDITITGGRKVTLSGSHAGFTEQTLVTGTRKAVVSGKEELWLGEKDEHVGTNFVVHAGKYELHQGNTSLTFEAQHVSLDAADWVEVKHGGGSVKIETSGKIALTAPDELVLTCGASSISLKADGTIAIAGSTKVDIQASGAGVTCEPAKVAVHGPQIAAQATGTHEISGALVKIN